MGHNDLFTSVSEQNVQLLEVKLKSEVPSLLHSSHYLVLERKVGFPLRLALTQVSEVDCYSRASQYSNSEQEIWYGI